MVVRRWAWLNVRLYIEMRHHATSLHPSLHLELIHTFSLFSHPVLIINCFQSSSLTKFILWLAISDVTLCISSAYIVVISSLNQVPIPAEY